jgi:hypothetical protein
MNEAMRANLPDGEKNALRANHRVSGNVVVPSKICIGSNKPKVPSPVFGSTLAALLASRDYVADFVVASGRDTLLGLFDGCGVIFG